MPIDGDVLPAPLETDLGDNGGKVKLRSYSEITDWINKEIGFWAWVPQNIGNQDPSVGATYNKLTGQLNEARNRVSEAAGLSEQSQISRINEIKNKIDAVFKADKLPHSTTAKAKFIQELGQHSGAAGISALGYFLQRKDSRDLNPRGSAAFQGIVEAVMFEKGIKGSARSERKALEELQQEWVSKLVAEGDALVKIQADLEEAKTDFGTHAVEFQNQHNEMLASHAAKVDAVYAETKGRLTSLEKLYNEKLALEAPVTYWNKRKIHHRRLAFAFGFLFTAVLVLGLVLLFCYTDWLLAPSISVSSANASLLQTISFPKIGIVILYAMGVIWILRILARILLSHIHLGTDAGERVVMAQTYLALLNEGKAVDNEDRKIILQTLFRPSTTGVVHDDAIPPLILEWLTRSHK